jgi:hypothetical protein
MRKNPTPAEDASIAALVKAFQNDGHAANRVPRPLEDKPDALLEVGGVRIACECIQIPPEYIYKSNHTLYQPSAWEGKEILSFMWPNEPHQWVVEAVSKKARLWPSYHASTGAQLPWLLLHSPFEPKQFFLDGSKEWILWALRHGAKMVEHPFEQIFLWTPQSGIQTVFVASRDKETHSELGIAFSEGYPTLCVNRFTVPFSTLGNESSIPDRRSIFARTSKQVIVRPRDKEYSRHAPAMRNVVYACEVSAWATRAEVLTTVHFEDEDNPIPLGVQKAENLIPNTTYYGHYLHEFLSPKSLKTWHIIQPS